MNIYEPFLECTDTGKKYTLFFWLDRSKRLILASQRFICFINLAMRRKTGEYCSAKGAPMTYLMNLMNIYEVRIFKRFFENVVCLTGELMNLMDGFTSYMFINPPAYGIPPNGRQERASIWGERKWS